jgi:hypothetical protein
VDQLCSRDTADWQSHDAAAKAARCNWGVIKGTALVEKRSERDVLGKKMRDTLGGRNLIEIGLDQDIVDCAQIDRLDVVPELAIRAWRIAAK